MTAGNPDNKWKASSCLTGAFAVCERDVTKLIFYNNL
jgi:hypothetical protein